MAQVSLYVNADGITQQWDNQGVGLHWESVDESAPETAEYVYTGIESEDEEFEHDATSGLDGATINWAQVRIYAKATGNGDTVNIGIQLGITGRQSSASDTAMSTTFAYYTSDQFTAIDTVAKADDVASSLRSISLSRNKELQIAWVEIIIDYTPAAAGKSQIIFIN